MGDSPDIVVVGASAGGVEALRDFVASLPESLGAALFVVLHMSATGGQALPRILRRSSALPVDYAVDGEPIRTGSVMLAPPDHHLLLDVDHVRVTRGPRENNHRPSIDVLFRSAARTYGEHVTGVVLSGTLDDGTEGLHIIRQRGGTAIVQDPAEALYPSMPENAIAYAGADFVLSIKEMGPLLAERAGDPPDRTGKEGETVAETSVLPPEREGPRLLDVSCPACCTRRAARSSTTPAGSGTRGPSTAWSRRRATSWRPRCGSRCGRCRNASTC